MTLATVSRNNVRSQNKTKWEVYNLDRLHKKSRRRVNRQALVLGVYSKEEMAEYQAIKRKEREAMAKQA